MVSCFISRIVILVFGTLYPAYASYKAVRTKNVKEYVKWMMYWIVFALFTSIETFTDLFLSFWFPFYYELKIITVIYLLSPATNGSSILYRKFVHPVLTKREQEIDEYIAKAKEQGYHTVLNLGSKGVTYATSLIMQTAIKGLPILQVTPSREFIPDKNIESKDSLNLEEECAHLKELKDIDFVEEEKKPLGASDAFDGKMVKEQETPVTDVLWVKQPIKYEDLSSLDEISLQQQHESIQGGGGLVSHLKKSYSLSDLSDDPTVNSRKDEVDYHRFDDPRMTRRLPERAYNENWFFSEVDTFQRPLAPMNNEEYYSRLPSSEEISSGYSSADQLYYGFTQSPGDPLVRTASLGGGGGTRVRTRASTKTALPKRGSLAEGGPTWWSPGEINESQTEPDNRFFVPLTHSTSLPVSFNPLNHQSIIAGLGPEQLIALINSAKPKFSPPPGPVEEPKVSVIISEVNDKAEEGVEENSGEEKIKTAKIGKIEEEQQEKYPKTSNNNKGLENQGKESEKIDKSEKLGKYNKRPAPTPPSESTGIKPDATEQDDDDFVTPNSTPKPHRKLSSSYASLVQEIENSKGDDVREKEAKKADVAKSKPKKKTLHLPKMSFSFWSSKSGKSGSGSDNSSVASCENIAGATPDKNDLEYFIPLKGEPETLKEEPSKQERTEVLLMRLCPKSRKADERRRWIIDGGQEWEKERRSGDGERRNVFRTFRSHRK